MQLGRHISARIGKTTGQRAGRWRTALVTLIAATSAVGLLIAAPGTAGAVTLADLDRTIKAGMAQPVADDVLLSGDSSWRVPTGQGPVFDNFLQAFAYSATRPDVAPRGANDWSCKPKPGMQPVVLVHGTWENAFSNWSYLSDKLKRVGTCVYALNYGILDITRGGGVGAALIPGAYATGDIAQSAEQLARFVDRVRAATGSSKVNMVGHSQGGLTARQYLKFEGGADKVDQLVTLGATNHGTSLLGIGTLGRTINNLGIDVLGPIALGVGVSGIQQVYDSEFVTKLNAGGDTVPGVTYTVVATRYDEVTTPYPSTFLRGPKVRNITLQNGCPADVSDHLALSYSPRAASIVLNAFGARTPDGKPVPVVCAPNAWLFG
ncbi:alpha/beta fold hydrolase [Gordonia sinesedis]